MKNKLTLLPIFLLYQLATIAILPLFPFYLLYRRFKGKEMLSSPAERFGRLPRSPCDSTVTWIHGASVGEALSAGALISLLKAKSSNHILLTTVTASGKAIAARQLTADAYSLLPYDFLPCIIRAFTRVKPKALVIIENDFWPNLLMWAYLRNIPVYLINVRLKPSRLARYRLLRWPLSLLLNRAEKIYTQTQEDAHRLEALSIQQHKIRVMGEIKALSVREKIQPTAVSRLETQPCLLVGSLHPGELAVYLDLYAKLKRGFPTLKLILAPRHFHWKDSLISQVKGRGFSFAVVEQEQTRTIEQLLAAHDVLAICMLGKLIELYAYADIYCLGGTFVPVGGHNLLEPAAWRIPSLFGPYHENCRRVAQALMASGGAMLCSDPEALRGACEELLANRADRLAMGEHARHWLEAEADLVKTVLSNLVSKLYR